jgi:hypothetical protein
VEAAQNRVKQQLLAEYDLLDMLSGTQVFFPNSKIE